MQIFINRVLKYRLAQNHMKKGDFYGFIASLEEIFGTIAKSIPLKQGLWHKKATFKACSSLLQRVFH